MTEDRCFRPARLAGRESAGGGLTRVTVEPEPSVVSSYRLPGQYIEMRVEGETGFFALSNEPGSATWDLVMRAGGGASDVVLAIAVGSALEVTGALGPGFPLDLAAGHPLVVALNGTGVAAAPPIMSRRVRDGDAALTRVFLGVRAREEVPLESELRAWRATGADVVVCLSQPALEPPNLATAEREGRPFGIAYANGYVQDVVRDRVGAGSLSGGRIFAVGSSSMVDALRARAPELGLDPGRIHSNY